MPPQYPATAGGDDRASSDHRDRPLVRAAIDRTLEDRYETAAQEIDRIAEAAYRVIERTGDVDPKMRDILAEARLSTQAFYRHFAGKDDLLILLLDDGRRRLADYLAHQMEKVDTPRAEIRAWMSGVLAQAVDPAAAARTRPFITNLGRLSEQYPEEQEASVFAMVDLLIPAITAAAESGDSTSKDPASDALAVYHLATSAMQTHVLARTVPSEREIASHIGFVERALGFA